MKKAIQVICGSIAIVSVLVFLYGSIKFASVENSSMISDSITDIPGAKIEKIFSYEQEQAIIQKIVGTSLVTTILGGAGFWISSKNNTEESR